MSNTVYMYGGVEVLSQKQFKVQVSSIGIINIVSKPFLSYILTLFTLLHCNEDCLILHHFCGCCLPVPVV